MHGGCRTGLRGYPEAFAAIAKVTRCCVDGRVVVCCGFNYGSWVDRLVHLRSTALQWLPGTVRGRRCLICLLDATPQRLWACRTAGRC